MSALSAALTAVVAKLTSFRTIVALTTSTAVTVVVSGPMAYQAMAARDEIDAAPARTEVTRPPPRSSSPATPTTGPTTTIEPSTSIPPLSDPPGPNPQPTNPPPTNPPPINPPPTPARGANTSTVTPAVTSTVTSAALPAGGIVVSFDPGRSTPRSLDGATLRGEAYIGVERADVRSVRFWLDAPRTGPPTSSDTTAPFDLIATSTPLDVSRLAPGSHRLDVELTLTSGTTQVLTAQFTTA